MAEVMNLYENGAAGQSGSWIPCTAADAALLAEVSHHGPIVWRIGLHLRRDFAGKCDALLRQDADRGVIPSHPPHRTLELVQDYDREEDEEPYWRPYTPEGRALMLEVYGQPWARVERRILAAARRAGVAVLFKSSLIIAPEVY